MQIAVTFRHLEPNEGVKAYVREKVEKLEKYLGSPRPFLITDGLPYAMIPIDKSRAPLALAPAGQNRYAAIGRFRYAPNDSVMTIAERVGGRWMITDLRSVVEH